jgi:four helix bundle protein
MALRMHRNSDMKKPYDIQDRAFLFACEIVDFCRPLVTGHPIVRELGRQLLKAGTSVGANLEEADGGESKPDFRHKIAVSRKECRESRYWLRLIVHAERRLEATATPLIGDASELVAILTTIKMNAESNDGRGSEYAANDA